jgi:hypothetical protein
MVLLLVASALLPQAASAARQAARELVEVVGREAFEAAEPRIVRLIESYGDDAVKAIRRAGTPAVGAVERFGASGAKLLAAWGDDGLRVLAAEGDDAVRAFVAYGDDAVRVMVKHPGVGRELVGTFGAQAAKATANVSTESAINLARMSGPIRASGRSAEVLGVVERFGDRACAFLWRNKGVVFGAAVLATFLADPQPYLDGVKQLVLEPAAKAASGISARTNWTLVLAAAALGLIAVLTVRYRLWRRPAPSPV